MTYYQSSPHYALTNYIDAYWTAKGDAKELTIEKILPDGCVDIILNLGEDCKTDDNQSTMRNGQSYLVGTMTRFKKTVMTDKTHLFGIRFKPAAFSAFYNFDLLHEVTDQTVAFDKGLSPDIQKIIKNPTPYLDQFLLNRFSKPKHNLLQVIDDIQKHKGQINLQTLALSHFTTVRQLERSFKKHIGTSPKEFINLVRYQFALSTIQKKTHKRSLLDIAFECGYYDHSHLTNEVKRYTGMLPSQF
jgi:AraC-like DNA-binding protein